MATARTTKADPRTDRTGNNPTNKPDKVTNQPTRVTNAGPDDDRNASTSQEEAGQDNPNAIDRGTGAGKETEQSAHGKGRYQNKAHSNIRGTSAHMEGGHASSTDRSHRQGEEDELRLH